MVWKFRFCNAPLGFLMAARGLCSLAPWEGQDKAGPAIQTLGFRLWASGWGGQGMGFGFRV